MSELIIQERGDGFAHAGEGVKHDFAVSACTVDVECHSAMQMRLGVRLPYPLLSAASSIPFERSWR